MNEAKWYLRTQDETFGPETEDRLVEWAKLGRIQPGQEVSDDNLVWQRVEDVPFLDMRFSIDIGDGNPRGPFHRAAAEALLASGRLPSIASLVEVREPFPVEPAPVPEGEPAGEVESAPAGEVEPEVRIVEREVVKEVRVEVPVEKIVEKLVEVPVEKVVEKIVEKVVVDETRVKELEGLLAEERRHTSDLQTRCDETSKNAAESACIAAEKIAGLQAELVAANGCVTELRGALSVATEQVARYEAAIKDATDRENKYAEQVRHLEDELRRLPQAASEVADIQAAVFGIIQGESEEIAKAIEVEKNEFETLKARYQERAERLVERRRQLLKRSGSNVGEMTHKALIERPEDPRTAQLRKEFEELKRAREHERLDAEAKVKDLTERLQMFQAQEKRVAESRQDMTQLRQEVQVLREQLQAREKELVAEHQRLEALGRQQAFLSRMAALESPSIGTSQTMATNQSREARQLKLPEWMRLKR